MNWASTRFLSSPRQASIRLGVSFTVVTPGEALVQNQSQGESRFVLASLLG